MSTKPACLPLHSYDAHSLPMYVRPAENAYYRWFGLFCLIKVFIYETHLPAKGESMEWGSRVKTVIRVLGLLLVFSCWAHTAPGGQRRRCGDTDDALNRR